MVNWRFHREEDKEYTPPPPPKNENTKFNWGTIPVIALLIAGAFHYFRKESDINYPKIDSPKNLTPLNFTPKDFKPINYTPKNFRTGFPSNFKPPNFLREYPPPINFTPEDFTPLSIQNLQNFCIKENSINISPTDVNIIPENSILNQTKSFDSKIKIDGSLDYE